MSDPDRQVTGQVLAGTPYMQPSTPATSEHVVEADSLRSEASESPPISDGDGRSRSSNTTSSVDNEAPLSFSSASDRDSPIESPQAQMQSQTRAPSTFTFPPPLPALPPSSRPRLARAGSDPLRGRMQNRSPSPSNAPVAGPSILRPRASRYADPDHHWLSEDEGEHFSNDVRRNRRPARGAAGRQRSDSGNGEDKDSDQDKARALSLMAGAPVRHPISHKPATIPVDTTYLAGKPYTSLIPDLSSVTPNLLKSLECPTCGDLMQDPITLLCGHSLCLPCSVPKTVKTAKSLRRSAALTSKADAGIGAASEPPQEEESDDSLDVLSKPISQAVVSDGTCSVRTCRKVTKAPAGGKIGLRTDFVLQKITGLIRLSLKLSEDSDGETQVVSQAEQLENTEGHDGQISNVSSPDEETKGEASTKRAMGKRRGGAYAQKKNRSGHVAKFGSSPLLPAFVTDVLSELECQVCVTLLYEPITTACGHTFCKKCLFRSLDHSSRCPLCRSDLPGFNFFLTAPINMTISNLLITTFPVMYAERREMTEKEEAETGLDTPVFVCMVSFPSMPANLHIYEPRYRLMMRRAMDTNKRFGMVLPSRTNGGMSQYGTMLEIQNLHVYDDGRSLVEAVGVHRFKILESGTLDGYNVGRIERIEDIPDDQEEELERLALERSAVRRQAERERAQSAQSAGLETLGTSASTPSSSSTSRSNSQQEPSQPGLPTAPELADPNDTSVDDSVELTNAELLEVCKGFVEALRTGSTPWLIQRLNSTLPPMPEDPREFTWWMAMLMPIDDHEKAKLLQITSYRLRLRLLVFWVQQMQHSWWFSRGCSIC